MNSRRVMKSFLRMPLGEQRTMLMVIVEALAVECMIRVWPLPRVARILGVSLADTGTDVSKPTALTLAAAERRQLRCLRRVMNHWPFCAGTCLRESLLAGHILRRREPRLVLGVASGTSSFTAHAWLDVGGVCVGQLGAFRPLGRAPTPQGV